MAGDCLSSRIRGWQGTACLRGLGDGRCLRGLGDGRGLPVFEDEGMAGGWWCLLLKRNHDIDRHNFEAVWHRS